MRILKTILSTVLVVYTVAASSEKTAHERQAPLKFSLDAFVDVQGNLALTSEELSTMYYEEHKYFTEKFHELEKLANETYEKGDIKAWEKVVQELKPNQDGHNNWEFFWDSITVDKDENGKYYLPQKGSHLYNLVKDSFGDYQKMREEYILETDQHPFQFFRGQREKSKEFSTSKGWLWVLYNAETDQLEVKSVMDQTSYLDGRGQGKYHPILIMDKILGCGIDDIHVMTNWRKAAERLEEAKQKEYVLVTGGLGYIGSHTIIELIEEENANILIIDNLDNSKMTCLDRMKYITGKPGKFVFHQVDIRNETAMESIIFSKYKIKSVIHFAALKAVGESIKYPLEYYHNNVGATIILLRLMKKYDVNIIVFSSSATVYGDNPLSKEGDKIQPINPYGQTKAMIEQVMKDYALSNSKVLAVALRYFNPIGAHRSGLIGEDPKDIPNNLMPYIAKVATRELPFLRVFGNDYDTPDGTGVRDYIHVTDLARGHTAALKNADKMSGYQIFNLGTGSGTSVLQLKDAFEEASGVEIPFEIHPRRPGDSRQVLAIPDRANKELNWKTEFGVKEMCKDVWKWVSQNPNGYRD